MSEHHHINENKCRYHDRPVFGHKCGLIEQVSHHHVDDKPDHGGVRQHNSPTFVCHRIIIIIIIQPVIFYSIVLLSYYYRPNDLTICPNIPPHKLFMTISALDITNISVANIPANLFTKSLIEIIMR